MEKNGMGEQRAYIYAKGLCEIAKMESGGSLAGKRVALLAREPLLFALRQRLRELYAAPVFGEELRAGDGETINVIIAVDEPECEEFISLLAPGSVIIDAAKAGKERFRRFDSTGGFKRVRVLNIGE